MEDLTKKVVDFRDARDWKQFHNPKDDAISLILEAGELLEHFQWKNEKEITEHVRSHKEDIGDELSDVLYWVLVMANDLNINITKAFENKLKKTGKKYSISKSKGNHKKYTEL